jgi:hypothetical protein
LVIDIFFTQMYQHSYFHSASHSFYKHNTILWMHDLFQRINVWLHNGLLPDPIVLAVDSSISILRKSKPNFKPKDGNLPSLNCVLITRKPIQLTKNSFFMVFHWILIQEIYQQHLIYSPWCHFFYFYSNQGASKFSDL